jgi:hypothetical protein
MSMASRLMQRALKLSQAGNQKDARLVLQAVIKKEPHNEHAWLQYLDLLPNDAERTKALEQFLRIVPNSQRARKVLLLLKAQKDRLDHIEQQTATRFRAPLYALLGLLLLLLCLLPLGVGYFLTHNPWQKTISVLNDQYTALASEYNSLQRYCTNIDNEYALVLDRYSALEGDFNNVVYEYNLLMDQHETLKQTYDSLAIQHQTLRDQHSILQQDHDSLIAERNTLQNNYDNLLLAYNQLAQEHSRSISPPYIYIHNRTVQIAFEKTNRSIGIWQVPFDSLEADILRGNESRTRVKNRTFPTLDLMTDTGETLPMLDYTEFVDSQVFAQVVSDLYRESDSAEAFLREVWSIVTQLSLYSAEIADTPRYPLETFLAGGGDCEDTSILLASMISSAPTDWQVDLVYMDSDNPLSSDEVNHIMVYVDTGIETFYIETTNDQVMEPYEWVRGWRVEVE